MKDYTEKDLVSFAEYCLERARMDNGDLKHVVYHVDLMTWMEKNRVDLFIQKLREDKIKKILE